MRRIACAALASSLLAAACSAGPAPAQTGAAETARRMERECKGEKDRSSCYDAVLRDLAQQDVREALETVEALSKIDGTVERDGHMYVHAVGISAYDASRDFGELFRSCTELFHAGCYHGLIQARFAEQGEITKEAVNTLCDEVADAGADHWTYFQCLHGIGHGLVIHADHDLIQGLAGCDMLDDPWANASCQGGAFMENVTNATHPHHAALTASLGGDHGAMDHGAMDHGEHAMGEPFRAIDPDDPHYPCSIVQSHQKSACYGMQTSVILYLNEYDFEAAAKTCDGAEWAWRAVCHQSLGRDASGFANRDVRKVRDLCALDRSEDAPFCYVGAAKAAIDWSGEPMDGIAFCTGVRGDENRLRCYQAVGQQVAVITPTRGNEICGEAKGREEQACLFGAGLLPEMPAFMAPKSSGASGAGV